MQIDRHCLHCKRLFSTDDRYMVFCSPKCVLDHQETVDSDVSCPNCNLPNMVVVNQGWLECPHCHYQESLEE